jgi:hypothetical protein
MFKTLLTRSLALLMPLSLTAALGAYHTSECWSDDTGSKTADSTDGARLLQQLSKATSKVYAELRPGIVRVELPLPTWMAPLEPNAPLSQWRMQLDPAIREWLEEPRMRELGVRASITPTTQPTDASSALIRQWQGTINVRPDGTAEIVGPGAASVDVEVASTGVRVMGLVSDTQGHVLIPMFVDVDALGHRPIIATGSDGRQVKATYVGADRKTSITLLKLETPIGKPVPLTQGAPAEGSLIMILAPDGESGKLSLWTNGTAERGIVVSLEGGVAGFARRGQFLSAAQAQPLVEQIILHGKVRRAVLGVTVTQDETPSGQRAIKVLRVAPGSSAEKAGLKEGDFIVSLAGQPVMDVWQFGAEIAKCDGATELHVVRAGESLTVRALLKPE